MFGTGPGAYILLFVYLLSIASILFNTSDPALDGKTFTAKNIVEDKTAQFMVATGNGTYKAPQMHYRDVKKGSVLPDTSTSFPTVRPPNTASDGARVHNLDSSNPVRVSSGEPHTRWAWDLNGDPVLLRPIAQSNSSSAQVDIFGSANIYTGVDTPLFSKLFQP
jgi:hypothetical protein